MIIVTGRVRLKDDADLGAFAGIAKPMCEASRAEDGCNAYRYAVDLEDDRAVVFHEEWESEEALAAHFQEPHFADFGAKLGGFIGGGGEFTKWVGAERTKLF